MVGRATSVEAAPDLGQRLDTPRELLQPPEELLAPRCLSLTLCRNATTSSILFHFSAKSARTATKSSLSCFTRASDSLLTTTRSQTGWHTELPVLPFSHRSAEGSTAQQHQLLKLLRHVQVFCSATLAGGTATLSSRSQQQEAVGSNWSKKQSRHYPLQKIQR